LVKKDKVEDFTRVLAQEYSVRMNKKAKIYVCHAEDGAGVV
jgi:galactokinase